MARSICRRGNGLPRAARAGLGPFSGFWWDRSRQRFGVFDAYRLQRLGVRGRCVPLYPHNAIRSNTVFEAVRAAGGVTGWADKHAAYDLVNGPWGKGVDDLYTPEITNAPGFDNTVSVVCTAQNDFLKAQGVINQIHGRRHDGTPGLGIPTVFGMNFQAVSVGQKLAKNNKDGSC